MDGWLGGREKREMNGWIDGWMVGKREGRRERWMDGWMDGCMDEWMDRGMDGQIERDTCINRYGCLNGMVICTYKK